VSGAMKRASSLPKLPPSAIVRPRIASWLAKHDDMPLRLLAAPAGSGKTTAIATYLGLRTQPWAYVHVDEQEHAAALRTRIVRALGTVDEAVARDYDGLLEALATAAPVEICIDDADRAAPGALAELNALIADAPAGVTLIYAMRSRAGFDASQLLSRGTAVMLDATALAFDADEVSRLATALGVTCSSDDATALVTATDGWPIVAGYVLRECAEGNVSATGAYDRWSSHGARHFAQFLARELERDAEIDGAELGRLLGHDDRNRPHGTLESLEERGLFVRFVGGAFRPYRVIAQLWAKAASSEGTVPHLGDADEGRELPVMAVRMFGRFEVSIEGRPITWIRRRDAQIVKYLLLKPSGSASRAELRQMFWPDVDLGLSTQSLRTACSNIRKAIASVIGYDQVERYFEAGAEIAVHLTQTVLDVRRFTAHVGDGDGELDRGNAREALTHYVAAERLYGGELLGGEAPEPWYEPRAEMFRALYVGVLQRLADLSSDAGDDGQARAYRERLRRFDAPGEPAPRPPHLRAVSSP
jgi:DNA-binding SARP family transcriptional activator